MYPLAHLILSLIFVILLKFFTVLTPLQLVIILLASILIYADHWIVFVLKKKNLSVSAAYNWFVELDKSGKKFKFLYIFHTIECFAVMALLSIGIQFFRFVLIGMAFHLVLDIILAIKEGSYFKEVSIIYTLLK